ncbi:SDR family NAD(P)-dependent oxidoreductase [Sungkyunkwania multivorans]|uniref:SDR family NAD(P)-dependent oxidoreductase n=1 Tax=Sungkyunkwania multivorans TaxID=1173618 RepID=A0ABW3CVM8_9FLAO
MKKNILIIGGSYGIGSAIINELGNDYHIFTASRTFDGRESPNLTYIEFDASRDSFDSTKLPDEIHGFVYCPGSINLKPFKMLDLEAFQEDFDINFLGMVRSLKAVMPKMAQQSSVVLFSTVAVQSGMPFHTSVAASKGAIEGFARSLAAEYAPKVRVNVIAPSLVDTPLAKRLLNNDNKREKMNERHPLKRVGKPEDIAKAATYLLSDDASWITGQVIGVDGGISTLNLT